METSDNDIKPFNYEGDLDDLSRPHGNGVGRYSDNQLYNGSYVHGFKDGTGTYSYSDFEFYTGYWKKGKREGLGIYIYPNKSIYKGNWENDRRHGEGLMKYRNGNAYYGEWFEGEKEGKGLYYFKAIDTLILSFWKRGSRDTSQDVLLRKDLINLDEVEEDIEETFMNSKNVSTLSKNFDKKQKKLTQSLKNSNKKETIGDNEFKETNDITEDIPLPTTTEEPEKENLNEKDIIERTSKNEKLIMELIVNNKPEEMEKEKEVEELMRDVLKSIRDEDQFTIEIVRKKVEDVENNRNVENNVEEVGKVDAIVPTQPEPKLPSVSDDFTRTNIDRLEISVKQEITENAQTEEKDFREISILTAVRDDSAFVIELVKKKEKENDVVNENETTEAEEEIQDNL